MLMRNLLLRVNQNLIPRAEMDILGVLFSFIQD